MRIRIRLNGNRDKDLICLLNSKNFDALAEFSKAIDAFFGGSIYEIKIPENAEVRRDYKTIQISIPIQKSTEEKLNSLKDGVLNSVTINIIRNSLGTVYLKPFLKDGEEIKIENPVRKPVSIETEAIIKIEKEPDFPIDEVITDVSDEEESDFDIFAATSNLMDQLNHI